MPQQSPVIVWFRRDLRLADNPALHKAAQHGGPVIPVYILDTTKDVRPMGGASLWWLDKSLKALGGDLEALGSRLILRRGPAGEVLKGLVEQTGAECLLWNRLYDPDTITRDKAIKAELEQAGVSVTSCNAALLTEPWEIKTGTGGSYKIFTPFWRALRSQIQLDVIHRAPEALPAPARWPASDKLTDWGLHPAKPDWSKGFSDWTPGEAGASERLHDFLDENLRDYTEGRDFPAREATSRLSPHLHFGEIGPRAIWRAGHAAAHRGASDSQVDKFLSELGWREFNHGLLYARPDLPQNPFKPAFDHLPWRHDKHGLEAWKRGRTGFPFVDAGMRELWATGYMENRVRMITASFLTKHLLVDWREGEAWFWDTLLDADMANNVNNWQWVAGCGADASPFFRIFNPIAQGQKFDAEGDYIRRWVPELAALPAKHIHEPWKAPQAVLDKAGVRLGDTYAKCIVEHDAARRRALDAYQAVKTDADSPVESD
ncbi:deoxyribodipyrimidine photo-lyase [Caulobacter segnis]|uniref:cryptochrome/photolyase family protein n=1 Tax=Caulobacter segnis TaxID=88688 RepID=UPI00240EA565|nr:deoxyribodipyrimidine photo-lyase [Caulobacter segnis]MDG2521973.1 deoxyribodipyrimidine photo-lyase [Caulobacter segnis]